MIKSKEVKKQTYQEFLQDQLRFVTLRVVLGQFFAAEFLFVIRARKQSRLKVNLIR